MRRRQQYVQSIVTLASHQTKMDAWVHNVYSNAHLSINKAHKAGYSFYNLNYFLSEIKNNCWSLFRLFHSRIFRIDRHFRDFAVGRCISGENWYDDARYSITFGRGRPRVLLLRVEESPQRPAGYHPQCLRMPRQKVMGNHRACGYGRLAKTRDSLTMPGSIWGKSIGGGCLRSYEHCNCLQKNP